MHTVLRAVRPRWRLLDTPPAGGAWNMAVDEALEETVRAGGEPVLRFYRWSPPCLSLGRNQPADGYDRDEIRRRGLEVVRRPTGGRAVLHHRELTYSAVMHEGALGSPRAAYAAVNRALLAGLARLGVAAALQAGDGPAPKPSLAPCFQRPVEGEVTARGAKLVGSAQRRSGGVLLQHGSIPLEDDQSLIPHLLRGALPAAPAPPATLSALLGAPPAWEVLVAALAAGWEEALGVALRPDGLSGAEAARAAALHGRFADPAWTWHGASPLVPAASAAGGEPATWTREGEG